MEIGNDVAARSVIAGSIRTGAAVMARPIRGLGGAVIAIAMILALLCGDNARGDVSIREVTTSEAADLVREGRGRDVVVVLCQSACPRSRAALSELARLAGERSSRDIRILVFAIDRDVNDARASLGSYDGLPDPYWIIRWKSGELTSAMGKVGITIGKTFGIPFVAVVGPDGRVRGQWEGVTTPNGMKPALDYVR